MVHVILNRTTVRTLASDPNWQETEVVDFEYSNYETRRKSVDGDVITYYLADLVCN